MLTRTARALPTMLRIGLAEAIAYRAEMLVWVLSTTMPFVMWVMMSAVAEAAPLVGSSGKQYGASTLSAYYLAMFISRQLVSSWASWEMNWEVRQGTLAMRLLRPIHPIWSYGAGHVAAIPLRLFVSAPCAIVLFTVVSDQLPRDWRYLALWVPSLVGAWFVAFLSNIAVGTLCFYMESSLKVMEVWLACLMVLSGYLIPLDFFPTWLRVVVDVLPFRYQLGLPVEVLTGVHSIEETARLVATQWAWALVMLVIAVVSWNHGVKRFQAYGG